MEYTVHVGAQVGALTADELLGDRLLTALEHLAAQGRLTGPVTGQNTATGVLGATFCVAAADAHMAADVAGYAFRRALLVALVPDDVRIVEIEVHEEHEEAATAI